MRENVKLLLREDLLSFAKKAYKEKNNGRLMPEDRYLELLAGWLADVVAGAVTGDPALDRYRAHSSPCGGAKVIELGKALGELRPREQLPTPFAA
jgi:hypothetical protein